MILGNTKQYLVLLILSITYYDIISNNYLVILSNIKLYYVS